MSGVCLYLLAPRIAEVFAAWDKLGRVHPVWMVPAMLCTLGSFACIWFVQAMALGTRDWFSVIMTELTGNVFNRITPGGGATGTALQATMLTAAGFDGTLAGTALAVQSALGTAALVALPVFSIPFILAGTQIPPGLLPAIWIGIPVFVMMSAFGIAVFVVDGPLCRLGRAVSVVQRALRRDHDNLRDLGDRLLRSRDAIYASIAPRWRRAVAVSVLRWLCEYGVLVSALYGLGVRPDPALVLLAFTTASVLGLLPFTPGGLGFVEAGLTATLNLAGVPVGRGARRDARLPAADVLDPLAGGRRRGTHLPAPISEGEARRRQGRDCAWCDLEVSRLLTTKQNSTEATSCDEQLGLGGDCGSSTSEEAMEGERLATRRLQRPSDTATVREMLLLRRRRDVNRTRPRWEVSSHDQCPRTSSSH